MEDNEKSKLLYLQISWLSMYDVDKGGIIYETMGLLELYFIIVVYHCLRK